MNTTQTLPALTDEQINANDVKTAGSSQFAANSALSILAALGF